VSAALTDVLAAIRAERAAARERGFELVGVFGSTARGEARPDSDVDVVFEVCGPATLFGLAAVSIALEKALGRPVDMVDRKAARPRIRVAIERELVTA
jgi:predicted nucleotidyltransferase